ncbi:MULTISPECIES: LysE family translocator [Parabacteroides]|uniref:Threonine/homoserine/homoserine lactone efflux protein n=1 Tax=Parabacteroides chinchillae TaxID=871327 RepID=A0A8G2F548_9BACT|nr:MULTISPECIES: LysE family transporter [Parabacteroides]SEF90227.1 Threonine/homoserine/homoserine lactone efflux protein [Parabacteroides chinchillae]
MLGTITKGLIIGILVSAPMGPIGMLCIQRTLNKGRWHGFITGLGAALSDVLYAAFTCLGMGVVVNFVEANQAPLQIIGSIVLGIFGYYIYQSNPVKNIKKQREKKLSFTQDFITAFLLTFSNVLIVLLYIGLFARFGFVLPDSSIWMLAGGIGCIGVGAILWWFGITYIVAKLRKWFNVRGIWMLNRIVGTIIIVLSIIGVLSVLLTSYFHVPLIQIYI